MLHWDHGFSWLVFWYSISNLILKPTTWAVCMAFEGTNYHNRFSLLFWGGRSSRNLLWGPSSPLWVTVLHAPSYVRFVLIRKPARCLPWFPSSGSLSFGLWRFTDFWFGVLQSYTYWLSSLPATMVWLLFGRFDLAFFAACFIVAECLFAC